MALLGRTTQGKIDDVLSRLAATSEELDRLDQLAPPSSDLAVEEENALKRLVRKEALNRVKTALTTELQTLQAKLAVEREAERAAKEAKVRADIAKAEDALYEAVWTAYEGTLPLMEAHDELDKVSPSTLPHRQGVVSIAERLGRMLEEAGRAKVTQYVGGPIVVTRTN